MIIVAGARCGGTIFAMDKAKEYGLEFAGEVGYKHFEFHGGYNNFKVDYHETHCQPILTIDKVVDIVRNPSKYVVLSNGEEMTFLIEQANYILLRKSVLNMVLSSNKFFSNLQSAAPDEIRRWTFKALHYYSFIAEWCVYQHVTPLWFEDLYLEPVNTYSEKQIELGRDYLDRYLNLNPRFVPTYERLNTGLQIAKA